jgi:hypothetical protein
MPSELAGPLAAVSVVTPEAFKTFGKYVDASWVEEAQKLRAKKATARKRKLPPAQAIWLVIGMALFRDRSIHEVVHHLELILKTNGKRTVVAPSAVAQARQTLGWEPLKHLFETSAAAWLETPSSAERWRGLSLWALDGTCFRVPDTGENCATFGVPKTGNNIAAYPQIRLVGLLEVRTHLLRGISFGAFEEGELSLSKALWPLVPDHGLVLKDRGLLSWWACHQLTTHGTERHWLMRAKSNLSFRPIEKLGPGDGLITVGISHHARKEHPDLPKTMVVRRIRSHRKGYRPGWLITSLLDPTKYPADELVDLYGERWEIELGYDEVKTHLLGSAEALRSKKPDGVRQELYGIALAYNLVRLEMRRVAREAGVAPLRVSFLHSLHAIRAFLLAVWSTSPGAVPRRLASLDTDLRLLILPERRLGRSVPRQVKIKTSKYPRKRRVRRRHAAQPRKSQTQQRPEIPQPIDPRRSAA